MTTDDWFRVESVPTKKMARGPINEPETIETLEGDMEAAPGDYIILEPDGATYPIKPQKFKQYYRVIGDGQDRRGRRPTRKVGQIESDLRDVERKLSEVGELASNNARRLDERDDV